MFNPLYAIFLAVACWVLPLSAQAEPWFGAQFAADIVMYPSKDPKDVASGKLYAGDRILRAEGTHNGQSKIVIIDYRNRKSWTVLPDTRQYLKGLVNTPMPPRPDIDLIPVDADSPCQRSKQVSCRMMGKESIQGIDVEKWEISAKDHQGNAREMWLWVDPQRRLVLRKVVRNGPSMKRMLHGTEVIQGRPTEKWGFVMRIKGQPTQRYFQWIDTRLRVPVRVMRNDQVMAELTNIREGAQAASIFQLPSGYTELKPPRPSQNMPSTGGAFDAGR